MALQVANEYNYTTIQEHCNYGLVCIESHYSSLGSNCFSTVDMYGSRLSISEDQSNFQGLSREQLSVVMLYG